jgi:hypothetical protein
VTVGCGTGNRFCPQRPVSREQVATFITRALALPAT